MAQINLLDSQQTTSFKGSGYKWLSRLMTVFLVVVILGYGYFFIRQRSLQSQINDVRSQTAAAQTEATSNTAREELLTRQGQLVSLNPLIKNHVYWSGLLPELARISLRQSGYTSIEAASNGNLILSVEMPTYTDLDKFLQIFDLPEYNRQFSNVRVLSINKVAREGQIAYLMRVQLTFSTDFIKNANP
jgi:hypothetical protein